MISKTVKRTFFLNFVLIFLLVTLKNDFARTVDAYFTCYHETEMYF